MDKNRFQKRLYFEMAKTLKIDASFTDPDIQKLSLGVVGEFNNEFERSCFFLDCVFKPRTKKRQLILMTYCLSLMQRVDFLSISPGLIPLESSNGSITMVDFQKLASELEPVFQNLLSDIDLMISKPPVEISRVAGVLLDYLTATQDRKIRGCLMSMFGWAYKKRMQKLNDFINLMLLQMEGNAGGQSMKFVQ